MADFTNADSCSLVDFHAARSALIELQVLLGGDDAEGDDSEFHPDREENTPHITIHANSSHANVLAGDDTGTSVEICGELDDMA